jgi:hypothetical protein
MYLRMCMIVRECVCVPLLVRPSLAQSLYFPLVLGQGSGSNACESVFRLSLQLRPMLAEYSLLLILHGHPQVL